MKKENDVSPRCKISTETKTETISSRYFNPLGKSNFWQASQDFDPPFFFFQRFGAAPSSSMLVHAHNRKIPCSFFLLLSLGSIPVFRFERSIATFIKARNRENFCHPLVVIFYPVREIERNAMHNSKFFIGIIHADRMI